MFTFTALVNNNCPTAAALVPQDSWKPIFHSDPGTVFLSLISSNPNTNSCFTYLKCLEGAIKLFFLKGLEQQQRSSGTAKLQALQLHRGLELPSQQTRAVLEPTPTLSQPPSHSRKLEDVDHGVDSILLVSLQ